MARKFLSEQATECNAVAVFPTINPGVPPTSKQYSREQSNREMFTEAFMAWAENDVNGQEARKRFRETVAWLGRNVAQTSAWNQLHALEQLLETQHKISTAIVYTMRDLEARIP